MTPSQKKIIRDYFDAIGIKNTPNSEEKTRFVKNVISIVTNPAWNSIPLTFNN